MSVDEILSYISKGRTDFIFQLMKHNNWKELLNKGSVKPLQWLVYYNDTTALKAVLESGCSLDSIDVNAELSNAAFFGHWKVCDFLINQGADPNRKANTTNETPLHNALTKAGRPYYYYTVRLLLENGADVNPKTTPDVETGAFMRDVRTKGETPLHRAAAYADEKTIELLIKNGANKELRDANGDTPLSWASQHLRPGTVLALLTYGDFFIGEAHKVRHTSDHGQGWGNGMEWNLMGDYLPENQQ